MKKKPAKNLLLIISIIFYIFLITYTITVKVKEIDSVSIGIETIIILIFSFYFFYEMLNDSKIMFINNDYRFWITLGMILYLAGTFFLYIYADSVPKKELVKFWFLTFIFYILKDFLFTIGIIVYSRKRFNNGNNITVPHLDFN